MSNFQKNLKKLADKYTQKYIAEQTGFSQSSINNYLTKSSEPSIQFLIALKNAFGICLDDFLFSEMEDSEDISYERFIGNYIVYYYNNNAYKGEIHSNLSNTLNYGVVSIIKEGVNKNVVVYGTFLKEKSEAVKLLKRVNATKNSTEILEEHKKYNNLYKGTLNYNQQSIFIELGSKSKGDQSYMIFNNPPSNNDYIGGVGTVNTVARGREHNPCVEFIIISKKLIDKPDGELYKCLKFDDFSVNFDNAISDLVELFKRLFVENNEISTNLLENQKYAIIQNKFEFIFNEIVQANLFRFAKISNKEDDTIYKLIKEGIDV
ncbi:MAG: helix-turn-helix transcriptional regulator [Clostridiales bacterium]|nr:helix-turn-helix transcriptional regulator [Clostridiales bacterium]